MPADPSRRPRTTATPLSLLYLGLIVYASLYPFGEWRDQGSAPWAFLSTPWPRYWTGFDVGINVAGYMPFGFLLALAAMRSGRDRWPVLLATTAAALTSLALETLQAYLPMRVPSSTDLSLNVAGAWLGACSAWLLERQGAVAHWERLRARWFTPDARGALVLLALWPPALLFPAAAPLALGQVMERFEAALAQMLEDSPLLEWLPLREVELQPMLPAVALLCIALGLLVPTLLGYSVMRSLWRRALLWLLLLGTACAVTSLSAALSYGPQHLWTWLDAVSRAGLSIGATLGLLLLPLPRRACAALALLALGVSLAMLNQAASGPYLSQTLQAWEQGRFVRFSGVAQWLGWLWPYAALIYLLVRLSRREAENRIRP